jgi:protein-arginine kinase
MQKPEQRRHAVSTNVSRCIQAVGDSVKKESGKDFMLDPKYGFIHSCPTNLGTGMMNFMKNIF